MVSNSITQKVRLVDGIFAPSEAFDIVNSLIREKINVHKLHRLSISEGDIHSDTKFDDSRVSQLLQEKENFKPIYKEAMLGGKRLKISGVLNIEIID